MIMEADKEQKGVTASLARPDNDLEEGPPKYDEPIPTTSETTRLHDPTDEITNLSDPRTTTVQIQDPPVSETRGYEIVKIEEKHGVFHSAIPVMPLVFAVIFCLVNLVLPGIGTLLSAPLCFCCPTRHASSTRAFFYMLLAAFLQVLTFLVIVGWIWSIQWGIVMIQLARAPKRSDNGSLPYYVRRQSSIEQSTSSKA